MLLQEVWKPVTPPIGLISRIFSSGSSIKHADNLIGPTARSDNLIGSTAKRWKAIAHQLLCSSSLSINPCFFYIILSFYTYLYSALLTERRITCSVKEEVEAELKGLTASLFEEAHNLAWESNMKHATSLKLLKEANLKLKTKSREWFQATPIKSGSCSRLAVRLE
ncbi:uncharacterized protein LOC143245513 [Tachypleus tridentatus]|uniref:uncharacterized protein LOC143245513 n=1 Tax=Tachypleus tridentatus TaxID=6853 RepID=UPI003FD1D28E